MSITTGEEQAGAGRRILVVDDEHSIVDAVATALRYEGFDVEEAHTGRAALDTVLRECIDLPAARIAERIEEAAVERQHGSSRDDIAILVVRIEP